MKNNEINENARILIMSNNSLSSCKNNGKTLSSFFKNLDINSNQIGQIYFSNEVPDSDICFTYYRISDVDVIKSIIKRTEPGQQVFSNDSALLKNTKDISINLKKSNLVRLVREIMWKTKVNHLNKLYEWLDDFNPNVILFCAGDSLFAYNLYELLKYKYKAGTIIYVTDDYILSVNSFNLIKHFRRKLVRRKLSISLQTSDQFITISDSMREVYKMVLGKDSIVLSNMTEIKPSKNKCSRNEIEHILLLYAGGFHFNRYKILIKIGKAIDLFNKKNKTSCKLLICSNEEPRRSLLNKFNQVISIEFLGSKSSVELAELYNNVDILVHVESFDKKSIEATRLSFSTKITEYLSIGKCILAVGPKEVATIKYLKDQAFVIEDSTKIDEEVSALLINDNLRIKITNQLQCLYKKKHNLELNIQKFADIINKLSNEE